MSGSMSAHSETQPLRVLFVYRDTVFVVRLLIVWTNMIVRVRTASSSAYSSHVPCRLSNEFPSSPKFPKLMSFYATSDTHCYLISDLGVVTLLHQISIITFLTTAHPVHTTTFTLFCQPNNREHKHKHFLPIKLLVNTDGLVKGAVFDCWRPFFRCCDTF